MTNQSLSATSHLCLSIQKGQTICHQGEVGEYWYEVTKGFIMLCHHFPDGRRQVSRFAGPGDAFGFEVGIRQISAEALTDGMVIRHPSNSTPQQAQEGFSFHSLAPHPAMWHAIESVEETMRLLSYTGACERLTAFLLSFSRYGDDGNLIDLPMSRRDLADHLGLAIHTISRTISQLCKRGYIALERSDRIRITNRKAFEQLIEYEGYQARIAA